MKNIPEGFDKIIKDFLKDILNTFPEYKDNLDDMLKNILLEEPDPTQREKLFNFCLQQYPERFFDILYQNEEIFKDEKIDTHFLPSIDFKNIWFDDISNKTREIIWKYLQLILFSIVGAQNEGKSFGETAKFFEAIDEEEFKKKLEETIGQMGDLFKNEAIDCSNIENLPNAEELHNHISNLLDGQLGCLAKEIAEETANEMNIDMDNITSVGDVFKQLFKNPGKLMKIVKKVGNKLDEKLKSGELKESELLKEATELMGKMGKTPGMKGMNDIFGQMGIPLGKNTRVNKNAFQTQMRKNMQRAMMRERMQQRLAKNEDISKPQKPKKVEEYKNTWVPETYTVEKRKKKRRKKKKKNKK